MQNFKNLKQKNTSANEIRLAIIVLILFILFISLVNFFRIMPFDRSLFSASIYIGTGLGAFIGFYYAHRIKTSNFAGKSLLFFGISFFLSFVAYLVWDYYVYFLQVESPYPSAADLFWVISIFSHTIGIFLLLKLYGPKIKRRTILEFISLFIILSGIIVWYLGWPDLSGSTFSVGLFDIIYTLDNVIMLSMALIVIRIAGGKIFKGLLLFIVGLIVFVIGDMMFAVQIANETYVDGGSSDIVLLIGWLINVAAVYYTARSFISSDNRNK